MKTSPAANKARSDISHFDEQHKRIEAVLREIACQVTTLINQKANYQMERALSNAASELQFCGDVTIEQSPSDAMAAAVEASSKPFDGQHIAIFVDGSLVWKPNGRANSIAHLGAAVVYKSPEGSQGWEERYYFAMSKERNPQKAESFAIAQGAAVAIELIKRLRRQNISCPGKPANSYSVTIFSDCLSALGRVKYHREKKLVVKTHQFSDPDICKLIMRSQHLQQMGIHLRLCWVPGHLGIKGNTRAHEAAKLAAKTQGVTALVDEGSRWIELEVPSDE